MTDDASAKAVLIINAGSSSIKFALFETGAALTPVSHGQVEGIGTAPHFVAKAPDGKTLHEQRWSDAGQSHEALLGALLDWVARHLGADALIGVGHRIVHGGADHIEPERITPSVLEALQALVPLAPLHQPHNLSPIRAIAAARPDLPQVACYDTAFHHTMPPVARQIALPRRFAAEGVRRYGFHGLSYEYIAGRLRETAPVLASGRVIVAHLGNGASLCAMRGGISVDTTMGFTALDGLVMGTRTGTIDPGAILYLQQQHHLAPDQVEHMLYNKSGLLGVSGVSSDMRTLLASKEQAAREAIEMFVFRIARETGALVSSLGGLDGFVFTAGIGENAAEIRAMVAARLDWLGARLDEAGNACAAEMISGPGSRLELRVIPTNEEAMIAHHTVALLRP